MSESVLAPASPSAAQPHTPIATTAAILGASSNGWSPLRTTKRNNATVSYSQASPSAQEDEHPSSQSPKKQTQNFKSLRTHGLVSNSIFKQIDGGSQSDSHSNSPLSSPSRRQAIAPSVGLGIGTSASPKNSRKASNDFSQPSENDENTDVFRTQGAVPSPLSSPRKLPRKSLGRLQASSYVSNSVFRQVDGNGEDEQDLALRSGSSTKEGQGQPSSTLTSTSNARGLLVSNRLHGPRIMNGSPITSPGQKVVSPGLSTPIRRERRKTVTFDEILDVQEFDKESSFDVESFQGDIDSEDGDHHMSAWVPDAKEDDMADAEEALRNEPLAQLKVMNQTSNMDASDEGQDVRSADSEPDLSDDSRETSSIEGPPSPQQLALDTFAAQISFDKSSSTPDANSAESASDLERDNSFARLSAADRVDSMVDELLKEDILNSPSLRARQDILPATTLPEPLATGTEHSAKVARKDEQQLPELPLWSPLTLDVDLGTPQFGDMNRSLTQPRLEGAPIPPPTARSGSIRGRPHISRDEILLRVAREKANQEQAQKSATVAGQDHANIRDVQMRKPRGSEPGRLTEPSVTPPTSPQKLPVLASRPSAPVQIVIPESLATETRPLPAPSPVKELSRLESPLELLGTELQESVLLSEADRHESATGSVSVEVAGELPTGNTFLAASPIMPMVTRGMTPAQQAEEIIARRRSKNGKARRKRSMSTSDARPVFTAAPEQVVQEQMLPSNEQKSEAASVVEEEEPVELPTRSSIRADLAKSKAMLDISLQRAIEGGFQTNMEQELSKIYQKSELPYNVNDRGAFQGVDDKVAHSTTAGDVDTGKAWKKLRRPSDINEYKKEMRELRESENPRRASGKVFMMVDSFIPTDLPVPSRPTMFHCILDNGLHMVKTATVPLVPGRGAVSKIGQEFELIQHKNLEFSLTLVVQRDAHLMPPQAPSSPTRKEHGSPTLKGLSRLFSSPKKQAAKREQQEKAAAAEMAARASQAEPMLAYINREGAFGRTGVIFERVASQCYAKCLVLELPVHGACNPTPSLSGPSSLASRHQQPFLSNDFRQNLGKVRGTLRLKLFYLPPLPSIPRNRLPENLAECIRGMQNAAWHRADPWQTGTLTQMGGDCPSWRRRPVKAQGQFLICYNAVTKKPTVKIDLSKAVCVEEIGNHVNTGSMIFPSATSQAMTKSRTLASHATVATLAEDEDADANYHVDRSFRITFADGERISFFADTEEEKSRWVKVITDIIESEVPANPLWAQAVLEGLGSGEQRTVVKKPSQQMQQARKPVPAVAEEAPATPKKDFHTPDPKRFSAGANYSSVETPTRHASKGSFSSTPSRLPVRTPGTPAAAASEAGSVRYSMMTPPSASAIRAPVHDPSNRAAFDRLKRAGHLRSQTEDLTPRRRY